ncbi:sulfur carrier protein ThiS [Crassaminicella profunda]|uniref:sulfur carrier protein ThiS n=1 Tax=Crassaminicella profunda TaxID=1286698 RepID=UPI001CA7A28D|nr:sulfur carrier protein ThiS [Crassaminicella profunda]QZY55302.1 sulfur carrier protein ThiS [Crassaminicella profunda]
MIINGKQMDFDAEITICELLKKLDLNEEKVVVEVNFTMIPKEKYKEYLLNKEDKVEIVSFVGGG